MDQWCEQDRGQGDPTSAVALVVKAAAERIGLDLTPSPATPARSRARHVGRRRRCPRHLIMEPPATPVWNRKRYIREANGSPATLRTWPGSRPHRDRSLPAALSSAWVRGLRSAPGVRTSCPEPSAGLRPANISSSLRQRAPRRRCHASSCRVVGGVSFLSGHRRFPAPALSSSGPGRSDCDP